MSFKVAFIGAGGVSFTRNLLTDLLCVPEFRDIEVAFTDIDEKSLKMVEQLCQRDIEHNNLKIKIHATTNRREAVKNANYVISAVRVGGLGAYRQDIDIPLRYGVDQCVGDTLCAGGIMFGQRGIAASLDFCKDIREVAAPDCLMINCANPNAMITWACNEYGGVKTVGICHGVIYGQYQIAKALGVTFDDLDIICAGINHQTWYTSIKCKGEVITSERLLAAYETNAELMEQEKVRIDILRRFRYFSTESNGHLSEYLPWYRKRPDELKDWICLNDWINGETGGYLRICTESRNWFENNFESWLSEPPKIFSKENRGSEHGSYIIEGLETGRLYRGHFNIVNNGAISNLPDDCVVEVPGYVDANGVNIPLVGDLPLGPAAICNQTISVQRMAVKAAATGDDTLLRQAMLLDPLTGAVCNPPEVWQMVDEFLVEQEHWLPQYKDAVKEAKERLKDGLKIPVRECYQGAARLKTATLDEMKAQREEYNKIAGETFKGKE